MEKKKEVSKEQEKIDEVAKLEKLMKEQMAKIAAAKKSCVRNSIWIEKE